MKNQKEVRRDQFEADISEVTGAVETTDAKLEKIFSKLAEPGLPQDEHNKMLATAAKLTTDRGKLESRRAQLQIEKGQVDRALSGSTDLDGFQQYVSEASKKKSGPRVFSSEAKPYTLNSKFASNIEKYPGQWSSFKYGQWMQDTIKKYIGDLNPSNYLSAALAETGLAGRRVAQFIPYVKWYGDVSMLCSRFMVDPTMRVSLPTMDDTGKSGQMASPDATITITREDFDSVKMVPTELSTVSSGISAISRWAVTDHSGTIPFLSRTISSRMQRQINDALISGHGTSAKDVAGMKIIAKRGAVSANATDITRADLRALVNSLDEAYLRGMQAPGDALGVLGGNEGPVMVTGDGGHDKIRSLEDGDGRPYLRWDASREIPRDIWGHPYVVNSEMDDLTTGKTTVLFANLAYYAFVTGMDEELLILEDSGTISENAVYMVAFGRVDGVPLLNDKVSSQPRDVQTNMTCPAIRSLVQA